MEIINKDGIKKSEKVEAMFDEIARRYDFLNHFLSLGTDRLWRRRAVNALGRRVKPGILLDVATGTCDLAIAALRLKPERITGIDPSGKMLEIGRLKIAQRKLEKKIELKKGLSEEMPFPDCVFDGAMCSFGVRNFEDTLKGLSEMCRVLKPGGAVMILEFSKPTGFPFKQMYFFYFKHILPFLGRVISGDKAAYTYLPESVIAFPEGGKFLKIMSAAGFTDTEAKRLTGGIATIYTGTKPV